MRRFLLLLATGFGSGYSPVGPGTAGTVVGVVLYLLLKDLSPFVYGITVVTFIFCASWVSTEAAIDLGTKDPQRVVIDEIAGYLVTMAFVPFSWKAVLIGFVLFRIFDITKPFPARWIERHAPAGWGIVGDDVMAGVYANIGLQILFHIL